MQGVFGAVEFDFGNGGQRTRGAVTRKRILDMAANEDLFVIGFHMPFPGIGHVERAQSGYRWVPHGYQLSL
jgi:hypothetical protein